MELAASRQGGEVIVLTGHAQGEKVAKEFPGAGARMEPALPDGAGSVRRQGGESFQFRSIGTQGPGELKIGKFTARRKGGEKILLAGNEIAAVHLRISLSGLLSIFWHGDYWYRKNDGRFLRYRGKNKPGGAVAVSELVMDKTE